MNLISIDQAILTLIYLLVKKKENIEFKQVVKQEKERLLKG